MGQSPPGARGKHHLAKILLTTLWSFAKHFESIYMLPLGAGQPGGRGKLKKCVCG